MPANLLDHALKQARVHRAGTMAMLVMDGNGHLACAWNDLMPAMRWAVTRPARPRSETCLEMLLERVGTWIVSSQCSLPPKGSAAHQLRLLGDLKSFGLGDGISWRLQKPAVPVGAGPAPAPQPTTAASHPSTHDQPASPLRAHRPPPGQSTLAPVRVRTYTQLGTSSFRAADDDPDTPAPAANDRQERRLRGDCRGHVIEESRNGGLHIELSGD